MLSFIILVCYLLFNANSLQQIPRLIGKTSICKDITISDVNANRFAHNIRNFIAIISFSTILTNTFMPNHMLNAIAAEDTFTSVSFDRPDILKNPPENPNFGLKKGRLLACRASSNCISTSSIDSIEKYGKPWTFNGSPDEEYEKLLKILNGDGLLKVVEANKETHYIHAVAKSAVPPTSLDDLEFLINDKDNIIAYRSNTRDVIMVYLQTPVPDGGSNYNRLEVIRRKLGASEMSMGKENDDYIKTRGNANIFQIIQEASLPSEINFIDNSVEIEEEAK